MNWEAISAVGEIVGALAVVVTLLFVARELRNSHKALSVSALRDTTAQWNQWSEMMATSSDLADIVARGNRAYESLNEAETLRYGAYVQTLFDNVESYRSMVVHHKLEKDLDIVVSIIRRRIEVPGIKAWWDENTADYDDDFVTWMESIIKL
jgi:hypothetical protein